MHQRQVRGQPAQGGGERLRGFTGLARILRKCDLAGRYKYGRLLRGRRLHRYRSRQVFDIRMALGGCGCTPSHGKGHPGAERGDSHSLAERGAQSQLLLEITQLTLTARAGAATLPLKAAFPRYIRDIVFIGNALTDFLQYSAFLFSDHGGYLPKRSGQLDARKWKWFPIL